MQFTTDCSLLVSSAFQMLHKDIDSYSTGTEIPAFQMDFSWEGDGPPKIMHHKIFINGVELTGCFFNISIYPNLLSPHTSPGWIKSHRVLFA